MLPRSDFIFFTLDDRNGLSVCGSFKQASSWMVGIITGEAVEMEC